jgi:hypothetical protein
MRSDRVCASQTRLLLRSVAAIRHSNAEPMVRQVLIENIGPVLDSALFAATAAVPGLRPAGLLDGVAALPPSSATAPLNAMVADIAAIAKAIAPAAAASQPLLIAAPAQTAALTLRAPRDLWPTLMSAALPDKTVIGVVPAAIASVIEPPRIEAGSDPVVQMDDAASGDPMTGPTTISLADPDIPVHRRRAPAAPRCQRRSLQCLRHLTRPDLSGTQLGFQPSSVPI